MSIATLTKFATFLALGLSLAAAASHPVDAASAVEIDAEVDAALIRFYEKAPTAKDFAKKAKGVLIFPKVVKAGFGVGGEYGEGALRIWRQVNRLRQRRGRLGRPTGRRAVARLRS